MHRPFFSFQPGKHGPPLELDGFGAFVIPGPKPDGFGPSDSGGLGPEPIVADGGFGVTFDGGSAKGRGVRGDIDFLDGFGFGVSVFGASGLGGCVASGEGISRGSCDADGCGVFFGGDPALFSPVPAAVSRVNSAGVVLNHGRKAETRAYTPGYFAKAHPSP